MGKVGKKENELQRNMVVIVSYQASLSPEYACDDDHLATTNTTLTMFVPTSSSSPCPLSGTYTVSMKHRSKRK